MRRYLPWLAVALALSGCTRPTPDVHDDHSAEEHAEESQHIVLDDHAMEVGGIEVGVVTQTRIRTEIDVPGTVTTQTKAKALVTPLVDGRIVSIQTELGQSVRAGQVLAILESTELATSWGEIAEARQARDAAAAALREAEAEVNLASAKVQATRDNLARQQELAEAGAFSQAPLQAAQNDYNEAQSELLSIQNEVASHAQAVQRMEALFAEGIVSRNEIEAARLEYQQDLIALEKAKSRTETAKAALERETGIASKGLMNAKELRSAEADHQNSQLELERARIRVRSARDSVQNARKAVANAEAVYKSSSGAGRASVGRISLVAPISGVVTAVDASAGQAVERTKSVFEIENLHSVWITANVPESQAASIQVGSPARITVAALPGRVFEGFVQVIESRIDPKNRTVPIHCAVPSAKGTLKPQMFATVHIGTGKGSVRTAVPLTALFEDSGASFVFVESDEGFVRRKVEPGESDGHSVAIASGLKPGEKIVVKGAFVLRSEEAKADLKGHDH